MGEVSGIVTFLNAFVYDVINFLYLQDLVLVNETKMEKGKSNKCKKILIKGLSTNRFHHAWQHLAAKILTPYLSPP